MTEEEAKTKWCPMVRFHVIQHPDETHVFHNKPIVEDTGRANGKSAKCLASGCMMWRWDKDAEKIMQEGVKATLGYCGLAGKP